MGVEVAIYKSASIDGFQTLGSDLKSASTIYHIYQMAQLT